MKKNVTRKICCAVSALTITVAAAGSVSAASVAGSDKCGGENMAVANVESELFIRKTASDGGEVVGYLPSAAGVIIESMNENWSKIKSGSVSGYVKTDYLAFGGKAEELKNVYGTLGAVASWDDVKVFSDYEDTSSIIGTINEGEGFEVLGSTDNWIEVQLANGSSAYVASEDVKMTTVLDTAVSTDETAAPAATAKQDVPSAENTEAADRTADTVTEPEYVEDYETPDYTQTEDAVDDSYTEYDTYAEDNTYTEDDGYTEDDTYTEEDTYVEDGTDVEDDTYGEDDAYTETDPVEDDTYYEEDDVNTETEETVEADDNDGLEGDEYIDPSTEAADEGNSSVSLNQSDVDLLAALIYCEAGNQSAEGKVAVGQVVMNRVASGSFAGSIHDVIYESGQFTPAMTGWLDQVLASGEAPSDCYDAAVAAMNGEGTVGDALYFNGGSGKGQQIGDHQFY